MEVTYWLLPLALLLSALGLAGFVWALRDGQLDDLEGPRWRILFEDDGPRPRPCPAALASTAPGACTASSPESVLQVAPESPSGGGL